MTQLEMEMNTMNHSGNYHKYFTLLIGIPLKIGEEIIKYACYTPENSIGLYHILYGNTPDDDITDMEWGYINQKREETIYRRPRLIRLPRIARVKGGEYIKVSSLNEKRKIESEEFKDAESHVDLPRVQVKNIRYEYRR
jgi:hypothetical protein